MFPIMASRVRILYEYYFVKCKVGIFFTGLIFGHNLVQLAVVRIMMTYLTDQSENVSLRTSAILVNAQEGLASVSVIFVAYITDAYIGHFQAITYTNVLYIAGLLLLRYTDPISNFGLYILMVALLAVGQAGRAPPLKAFLVEHLRENKNSIASDPKTKGVTTRITIWWGIPMFLGALVAIFVMPEFSREKTFAITVIVMGISLLIFLSGYHFYCPKHVTGSSITIVFRVLKNAFIRRGVTYSYEPCDYYKIDDGDELPLMPDLFLLSRWLDKAAIIEDLSSLLTPNEREERGQLNTVTEVKVVKRLLTMVPMWATFFMYCLVLATGNTFFFEQVTSFRVSVMPLIAVRMILQAAAVALSKLIVKRFKRNILTALKAKIGVGLAFSCLCCIVAQRVEAKRLDRIEGIIDDEKIVGMSVFWLVPQFCLLGIAQGLAEDGILQFFNHVVPKSMKEYGPPLNSLVLGIGRLISIFWILTFKRWIGHHINVSNLDRYYGILAIFSMGNLFFVYGFVTKYHYKIAYEEDATWQDEMQQRVITRVSGV